MVQTVSIFKENVFGGFIYVLHSLHITDITAQVIEENSLMNDH